MPDADTEISRQGQPGFGLTAAGNAAGDPEARSPRMDLLLDIQQIKTAVKLYIHCYDCLFRKAVQLFFREFHEPTVARLEAGFQWLFVLSESWL